jgi:hypothetical protein
MTHPGARTPCSYIVNNLVAIRGPMFYITLDPALGVRCALYIDGITGLMKVAVPVFRD